MNVVWQLSDPVSVIAAFVTVVALLAPYYLQRERFYTDDTQRRKKFIARHWAWWWRWMLFTALSVFGLISMYMVASVMLSGQDKGMSETLMSLFEGTLLGVIVFWVVVPVVGVFRLVRDSVRWATRRRRKV
jgi:hypothetical protein